MNRYFKKTIAAICAISMVLAFTSCVKALPQGPIEKEDAAESAAAQDNTADGSESGQASATGESVIPDNLFDGDTGFLQLVTENSSLYGYDSETYRTTFRIESTVVKLSDDMEDKYPELDEALDTFGQETENQLKSSANDLEASAASYFEVFPESEEYMYESCTPYIQRADTTVLSILYYYDYYSGGAHPFRSYGGENYDVKTGAKLKLDEVVTDVDAFALKVDEKLRAEYADCYNDFYTDPIQAVKDSVSQDGVMDWTLGYEEMTVYFSPYSLGAYAMGEQILTIRYEEAPELFQSKFVTETDSYIIPLNDIVSPEIDAVGNGSYEPVWVSCTQDDYGWEIYSVYCGSRGCTQAASGYSQTSYLVKSNGNYYVYIITTEEDEYVTFYTVDLHTMTAPSGDTLNASEKTLDWSYESFGQNQIYYRTEAALTDPQNFTLGSSVYILSSMIGSKTYHVGDDGRPVPNESDYTVKNTYVLKVLQPVEADIVDEAGNVTGTETLMPGTFLFFVRTDGEGYMDMQEVEASEVTVEESEWYSSYNTDEAMEPDWSEKVYRIRVDKSNWPYKVNGIAESEAFAGTHYAG